MMCFMQSDTSYRALYDHFFVTGSGLVRRHGGGGGIAIGNALETRHTILLKELGSIVEVILLAVQFNSPSRAAAGASYNWSAVLSELHTRQSEKLTKLPFATEI